MASPIVAVTAALSATTSTASLSAKGSMPGAHLRASGLKSNLGTGSETVVQCVDLCEHIGRCPRSVTL